MQLVAAATAQVEALANPDNALKIQKQQYGGILSKIFKDLKDAGMDTPTFRDLIAQKDNLLGLNDQTAMRNEFNALMKTLAMEAANLGIPVFGEKIGPLTDVLADERRYRDAVRAGETLPGESMSDYLKRTAKKKASGGIMSKRQLTLVGERGPELVLPQSRGLVLNNSISSRLLGMLTGKGGGGGNNVTINVNNPVIRSDNDIRKLATEISRVQASQFRTEGGRLY
jgi:hypothetical protein